MRVVMFYHSLISDWNHGNAHFLRGIASELIGRGDEVRIFEPSDAWSVTNLVAEHGVEALDRFADAYPSLRSTRYGEDLDLDEALDGADLVLVHEWNAHELVARIGGNRSRGGRYLLLFHDTHHRAVTEADSMASYELDGYDGVLAFGEVIREIYLARGWARRVWTWHEAADVRLFHPLEEVERTADLVWVGNWGDDERAAELREFLTAPVRDLRLRANVYGVRYPEEARAELARAGIEYHGWVPNFDVPRIFAQHAATIHVPRRPYTTALPGIPTIRPFEALACGIPLVSAPWDDAERLFRPGEDFLVAHDGEEMKQHLMTVLHDRSAARSLVSNGLETILERHTCAHRVDELMRIVRELSSAGAAETAASG